MNYISIPSALLSAQEYNGYTDAGAARKKAFHTQAKKWLKQVASALGLPAGSFELRSNQAGIAVSGEVTLHSNSLYIQVHEAMFGPGLGVLYRSCAGRKDYSGGHNHHCALADLTDEYRQQSWLRELRSIGQI